MENSSFGAVSIANNDHKNPVEWQIGTNQITKNPDQPQTLTFGPLQDYFYAQWVLTPVVHRCTTPASWNTEASWDKMVPYVYIDGIWRQAVPYIFDGEKWQLNS